jgi:pyruvate-formate lyase
MPSPLTQPYFRPPNLGPDCSTLRSARLRERRFAMGYEDRQEPEEYRRLAEETRELFLREEEADPALARARALRHVVDNCPIVLEPDALLVGGEDPFFFNLMLPALQADRHARRGGECGDAEARRLREAGLYYAACFEGHITPGLDDVLSQGIRGLLWRIEDRQTAESCRPELDASRLRFYQACRESCEAVLVYASRYREAARAAGREAEAGILERVPEHPARTFHEALQAYWIVYCLVTLEMGGCCPGGGLGLGRPDQFLYPYYRADLEAGRLTRDEALELMEIFLLGFRHVDYYTGHQIFTPGSQGSLGGVTPAGMEAFNELTELILEASLRIAMPAPYLSVRLHRDAPERAWEAAANYIAGGLGFPIVNDGVLIPAFLRHGRSLEDARDYICSCCYENTIPGREAFHPNGCYLNLPFVLELALNEGRSLLTGERLGPATPPLESFASLDDVLQAFETQLSRVADALVGLVNAVDESHSEGRRYPLMSCFMDACIERGRDVCEGGALYNLTGCIVAGLPNVVNSLAALRRRVFVEGRVSRADLRAALAADFQGFEHVRHELLTAPKWGNGDPQADDLASVVTEMLYERFAHRVNARGGRWQLALYSFAANYALGAYVGASADGRRARELLTRNLNPSWGTDRDGPTSVLRSLSAMDFTKFPDGSALDLVFDPGPLASEAGRREFAAFLKGFVDLGVMQMQISMVDAQTLLDARENPAQYPHLMVKVAGYSARFVDLSDQEQDELIGRTVQRLP